VRPPRLRRPTPRDAPPPPHHWHVSVPAIHAGSSCNGEPDGKKGVEGVVAVPGAERIRENARRPQQQQATIRRGDVRHHRGRDAKSAGAFPVRTNRFETKFGFAGPPLNPCSPASAPSCSELPSCHQPRRKEPAAGREPELRFEPFVLTGNAPADFASRPRCDGHRRGRIVACCCCGRRAFSRIRLRTPDRNHTFHTLFAVGSANYNSIRAWIAGTLTCHEGGRGRRVVASAESRWRTGARGLRQQAPSQAAPQPGVLCSNDFRSADAGGLRPDPPSGRSDRDCMDSTCHLAGATAAASL